ncbi:MAG: TRAP transporter large permease [Deltaproteobacteria bacterium]|nr:TRAP transporter large permease [Deltaproteobacteria bacterium]
MDPNILGVIIAVVSFIFLLSGMPIAFGLGVPSVIFILLLMDRFQFDLMAHIVYDGVNDFGLLAIPLFILMGAIIAATRAGADLYEGLHRWLHRLPGGLAVSNLVSCAIFAALCGSSPATAAAIGTMGIPEMRKRGYPDTLATGCIVAGGTLGILIPPSVTMIVYGIATQTSIGKLFIAGVIPGIIITIIMCIYVVIYSKWVRSKKAKGAEDLALKEGAEFFGTVSYTWGERFSAITRVIPFIIIIFLIMGSLYGGWATPSEAAAVGSVGALFLVMIIYHLRWGDYKKILDMTVKETTMIMLIIATSFLFGAVLTKLYITQAITNYMVGLGYSKWVLMALINVFLLILGCLMPPVAIILIINPILHPVILQYGFDPIWFGVIVTINMEIGCITPPVGLNLYIVQGIAPDVPLYKVLIGSAPFVAILLWGIVMCSIWPELALWLPNKMITR